MNWISLAWAPADRAFRSALARPREAQTERLRRYLGRNADTAFGRRYGFASIKSVAEYQQSVPLSTYDDLAPWIDRVAAGEPRVLTVDRVGHFALSSGSTRAAKLIPYTPTLHEEFRKAVAPWIVSLFRRQPDLARGRAYWSVSPVARERQRSAGGIAIGFEEDSAYLGGIWKRLIDRTMAVPADVRLIPDVEACRRATAEHLVRCRDLRLISVWHPSFLEALLDAIKRDPREIWPQHGLVSCWGDAHASDAMESLRRRLPGINIEPKGLIATEAFVSLPYDGQTPVAVRSHFFEFMDEAGEARLLDELQLGHEYSVVVTTGGGLYRYRLQDRVRVTGFVMRTPSLRFVGKEDSVSDLYGEKLSEGFVARCLRDVLDAAGMVPAFSMLAPADSHYVWYLDSDRDAADLDRALEQRLLENPSYRYCRDLGQLGPVTVVSLPQGYRRYVDSCVARGQRAGDVKPRALDRYEIA